MDVQLNQRWIVGAQLADGQGGFGRVHAAIAPDGSAAVAKFVPKDPGAERELLFGDSLAAAGCRNVIPVLDTGEHNGQWVIVMPRARESLRSHIAAAGGSLGMEGVLEVLGDVATALVDLAGKVVHRDLKPENILYFDGAWCLSDFGISRYAEATTGPETQKYNWTRPYAAPEQWNLERASSTTDIYALGVVAYELLSGRRPFLGPDYRQQHLHATPPELSEGTLRLQTLIEECLYKPPAARPTPTTVLNKLVKAREEPAAPGAAMLAQANRAEVDRLARNHASAALAQSEAGQREAMFKVASQSLASIAQQLRRAIEDVSSMALMDLQAGGQAMHFVAQLGAGKLAVSQASPAPPWEGPFEVVAAAQVTVHSEKNQFGWLGRSHSLWYCDAHEPGRFAWYETAFMSSPVIPGSPPMEPFALSPIEATVALRGAIGTVQVAWPFEELDRADLGDFIDRWLEWFAQAAEHSLHRPSTMPEKTSHDSWRRG